MAMHSHYDRDRLTAALVPIDAAFVASETKWGSARLERLVSQKSLESYKRGWTQYRLAIENSDIDMIEKLAPKMIAALAIMDKEATAAGHHPLSVDAWETVLADGTVLTIVRTMPEITALVAQAEGRQRVVYSLAEIARIIETYEATNAIKLAFPGATIQSGQKVASGVQLSEGQAADWARDEPMYDLLHGEGKAA